MELYLKIKDKMNKKSKLNILLIIINFIAFTFCLYSFIRCKRQILLIPLISIFVSSIVYIYQKNIKYSKNDFFVANFLTFCFFMMLTLTSCLKYLVCLNISLIDIFLKIIFLLSFYFSLITICLKILNLKIDEELSTTKLRKIILLIITIISLVFILTTTTGLYDGDFVSIWKSSDSGWSDWHTFGYCFLIYFFKVVFNSAYFVIIIHFILYIYFCDYALKIIEKYTKSKKCLLLFLFIILFNVVSFDQLRYLVKDVLFSLGFCNLIVTICDYLISGILSKKKIINFIIFSIITLLFRHGTILLIIFIFLSLIIYSIAKKNVKQILFFCLVFLSSITVNFTINYIGFNVLNGDHYGDNVIYTVPIYQVGAFASQGYNFSSNDRMQLNGYYSIEYMAKNFEKYNGDRLARSSEEEISNFNYAGFIPVNWHLFLDKPIYYVRSLLDLTNILWKINKDDYEWSVYLSQYDLNKNEWNMDVNDKLIFRPKETFLNKYVNSFVDIFLKKNMFDLKSRGALPLFLLIFSLCILIKKKRYILIMPISFALFWYAALFLSLPVGMTRYCLPFINLYPFIFSLILGLKKSDNISVNI